jgi:hypothetical protein
MALYNHDWSCLMGSTADNMTLEKKTDGLYFEFTPKGFEFDRRIVEFVKSGTIDGCSIGFRIARGADGIPMVRWDYKDEVWYRVIEKIDLYEITFTPIPAYESTNVDVEVRKLSETEAEPPENGITEEERVRILSETEAILKKL